MTFFFGNTGKRCLAGQTLIIVGDDNAFYNDFMEKVTDRVKSIVIGYGLDESVQMGPVREASKKEIILNYIEIGLKEGATLRLDGRKAETIKGDYPDNASLSEAANKALTIEDKIIGCYNDGAEHSMSLLADVPRNFKIVVRKRNNRLEKLKAIVS